MHRICSSLVDTQGVVSATCLSVAYLVSYAYLSSHSPPFPPLIVIVMTFIMKLGGRAGDTEGGRERLREGAVPHNWAADVNNYCPGNSCTQVTGQFPAKRTCLFTQVQII